MGLLDRWTKKQNKKVLTEKKEKAAEKKPAQAVKVEPPAIKTEKAKGKASLLAARIIIKPLVTEKAAVQESFNKYSFRVARSADKGQIKKAIEDLYGVRPISVAIVNAQGKSVRFGRAFGRRSDWKKALVTLRKGESITIHEGV